MRYFYDCEFLEDGTTIEPISIGMVAEDGREYYAVNRDMPWHRIVQHPWLRANVVPHLPLRPDFPVLELDRTDPAVKPVPVIAAELVRFIAAGASDRADNELWAYYAAYDHVMLCQLWGRMIDLPKCVPMFTHDLQQVAAMLGVNLERLAGKPEDEHNALADARWDARAWRALGDYSMPEPF